MKQQSTRVRAYSRLVAALPWVVVAACAEPASSDTPTAVAVPETASPISSVGADLGHLRAAVAQFQNIETAKAAGYTQLTGCMTDPTLGGMGFHFAKANAFDGVVDPTEPKALLYEPEADGRLRLVAVEFIVPYSVASREGPAPRLFNEDFLQNDAFQIWMFHAWIWKNNPAGMFASWNPTVTCDAVAASQRMSH